MLGQEAVKPLVKDVIQTERVIGVGSTVTDSFSILGIQFIKVSAIGHIGKGRERFTAKFCRQFLKTAVSELTKLGAALERHLRCCNGVIYGRHNNNVAGIGHLRLKSQVMSNLYDCGVRQKCTEKFVESGRLDVLANLVCNGYIDAGAFRYGEGATYDMCLVSIEGSFILVAVCLVRGSFIVEGDDFSITDIFTNALDRGDAFIVSVHSVVSLYGVIQGGRTLPGHRCTYFKGSITSPVSASTKGASSSATRSAVVRFAA